MFLDKYLREYNFFMNSNNKGAIRRLVKKVNKKYREVYVETHIINDVSKINDKTILIIVDHLTRYHVWLVEHKIPYVAFVTTYLFKYSPKYRKLRVILHQFYNIIDAEQLDDYTYYILLKRKKKTGTPQTKKSKELFPFNLYQGKTNKYLPFFLDELIDVPIHDQVTLRFAPPNMRSWNGETKEIRSIVFVDKDEYMHNTVEVSVIASKLLRRNPYFIVTNPESKYYGVNHIKVLAKSSRIVSTRSDLGIYHLITNIPKQLEDTFYPYIDMMCKYFIQLGGVSRLESVFIQEILRRYPFIFLNRSGIKRLIKNRDAKKLMKTLKEGWRYRVK